MADTHTTDTRRRRRFGVLGIAAIVACLGCCAVPFLAGVTVFGVAVCSTRFLGASLLGALAIGGAAGFAVYRVKRRKPTPGPVPVSLGPRS